MPAGNPLMSGPRVFNTFGLGAIFFSYLFWVYGADLILSLPHEDPFLTSILKNFALLITAVLIFACFVFGQFFVSLGTSIWHLFSGSKAHVERVSLLRLASRNGSDRQWQTFLDYEKRMELHWGIIGLGVFILLRETSSQLDTLSQVNGFFVPITFSITGTSFIRVRTLRRDLHCILEISENDH